MGRLTLIRHGQSSWETSQADIVVGTKVPIMLPSHSDPPIARLATKIPDQTANPAAGSPS